MLGVLYSEFHYETPPPAYHSLDHRHTATAATTAAADGDAAADDDAECDGSVIQSNPPSYRSQISRTLRHVTSNNAPPDYSTATSHISDRSDAPTNHRDSQPGPNDVHQSPCETVSCQETPTPHCLPCEPNVTDV